MNKLFLEKVQADYPGIVFRTGKKFAFRPPKTVIIGEEEPNDSLLLLHELGHALSKHVNFDTDARRLRMEREAWEKARELAPIYGVDFNDEVVEQELDTYREWLHKRSCCPKCKLTRYQTPDGKYHCPHCENFA